MKFLQRPKSPRRLRVLEIGATHVSGGIFVPDGQGGVTCERRETVELTDAIEGGGDTSTDLDRALAVLKTSLGGGPVHLVLPGHLALTKAVRLPAAVAAQRDKLIAFEARQNIPYDLDEVCWDHQLLAETPAEIVVLIAAAKIDAVTAFTSPIGAAGFEPVTVQPAGIALERAYRSTLAGGATEPVLLVGIGARSTHLVFIEGEAYHLRTLALAGHTITRGIAQALDQSFAEAEQLKRQVLGGVVTLPPESPAGRAVQAAVDAFGARLILEISRSLVTHKRQNGGTDPTRVILTGGGARVPGLAEKLTAKLQRPVEPLGLSEGTAELWGGAVAAAGKSKVVNLLPAALVKTQLARGRRPRWIAAAAMLILALALPGIHFQRLAAARAEAATNLGRSITPHYVWQDQIRRDETRLDQIEHEIKILQQLLSSQAGWTRFLVDLQTRMGAVEDVWFERLQVLPPATNGRGASLRAAPPEMSDPDALPAMPDPIKLRVSGRLLDRENPLSRVSQAAFEQATMLLGSLVESPFVLQTEGERFDAADPGILRFDFTLIINPAAGL
ncbi:pilus assembly protein PilM [Synoicihabitans lomoniglobus]|uniref:Pilus assembly protein PilM n=1 Tax=Synoicihabitans lomoniglobus TaxID=2909285 RepID=A0AAF0CRC9_9BACT|nr:pilus assembly protein PilM [Opitutaceae bacterium LMO-M01]WED66648.1 pilus assembly protein PilM [Opitutaceae bacterium LMO-M01]